MTARFCAASARACSNWAAKPAATASRACIWDLILNMCRQSATKLPESIPDTNQANLNPDPHFCNQFQKRRSTTMIRTASAHWAGGLKDGKGTVSTASGVLSNTQYSFATRFENGAGT